jgi:hypothetical protein
MAKIDTIELIIEGKPEVYNINIGKAGIFTCKVGWRTLEVLGIEGDLNSKSLSELKGKILPKYHDYLNAKKTTKTFISIDYKADGHYTYHKDRSKGVMFGRHGNDFYASSFGSNDGDRLVFDFCVLIETTHSTGVVQWHFAQRGQGSVNHNEGDGKDPKVWYKNREHHGSKNILIPYSDQAYETLKKAREGIRGISEILFTFLDQDIKLIEAQLNKGNLLNPPKEK